MIRVDLVWHSRGMVDTSNVEPRERLRIARLNAGLSREDLARRRGVSISTVAAHENGQNGITPEAASEYSRVLKVAPEWLLYGRSPGFAAPSGEFIGSNVREIPVVGEIYAGRFVEDTDETRIFGWLPFWVPKYQDCELSAFHVFGPNRGYRHGPGSFVVSAAIGSLKPRSGDEVVLRRWRDNLCEDTLHEYAELDGQVTLTPLTPLERLSTPIEYFADALPDGLELLGPVVGTYYIRPSAD